MPMEVFKEFTFEAAHRLEHLPEGHKCRELHGHSYRVRVFVQGELDPKTGWIIDFAEIKAAMKPILAQLDHKYLNEIDGLQLSTVENVARWIWPRLAPSLKGLARIELWETATSGVSYTGEPG